MKKNISLNEGWRVGMLAEGWGNAGPEDAEGGVWYSADMPQQLYDVLRGHGVIGDLSASGDMREYLAYGRRDWMYSKDFDADEELLPKACRLTLAGVDTFADVTLNGEKIATHDDLYLPLAVDVTGKLLPHNRLRVCFRSPIATLDAVRLPDRYAGHVRPAHALRLDSSGFTPYYGAQPYNRPMGIYDSVSLTAYDSAWLETPDIRTEVSPDCADAAVCLSGRVGGSSGGAALNAVLLGDGEEIAAAASITALEEGAYRITLPVTHPSLWWPKGYGAQTLYTLRLTLTENGRVLDEIEKKIGFRKVVMDSTLCFTVNGIRVRFWGSNFAPLHAHSYCYDHQKALAVLDFAEQANMNSLRIWGGGVPYRDELYDEADRRGIMLWQDFFHNWGMYPDGTAFRAQCTAEAEHLVGRLKHHPSILLWCGGNESYQGSEMEGCGHFYGWETFEIDYRDVVARLDPQRYYHPNSPYGGAYANDPAKGDSHVYSHIWFNRGFDYPLFQTENCRVFAPHLRSLKRMLGEGSIWDEGYTGQVKKPGDTPFPLSWHRRALLPDYLPRLPPIEKFYEAADPEALIYRFGAAHALHMRETIEQIRRGRPSSDAFGERRCSGHFVWRLFDTWPQIFCSLIDYYMEPYIPFYAVKRAYEPILVSFEKTDHIVAWITNDTSRPVRGTLAVKIFDPREGRIVCETQGPAEVKAGESQPLFSLDGLGEFKRECFLYAELSGEGGEILSRVNDTLDIERNLYFPPANLQFSREGEKLFLTTDAFARCVELSGKTADGEDFGFCFADNYFDLFPWERKEISLRSGPPDGTLSAQARFSPGSAQIEYHKGIPHNG